MTYWTEYIKSVQGKNETEIWAFKMQSKRTDLIFEWIIHLQVLVKVPFIKNLCSWEGQSQSYTYWYVTLFLLFLMKWKRTSSSKDWS